MSDVDLRPRSTSEIIDAAFALYRRNGGQYILVTALASAPGLITQLMLTGGRQPTTPGDLLKFLPTMLIGLFTFSLMTGVVQKAGSQVYLGGDVDLAETVKSVLPKVLTIILVSILLSLLLVVGFIFLFFGAFYVVARWFAVVPAVVLEDAGPFAAFGRSSALTNGQKWHALKTLVLLYLIYLILQLGVAGLATLIPSPVLQLILSTAYGIVALPITGLATMLLYYDLRIRNEAFDLEQMTQALGSSGAAVASGASY